MFMIQASCDVFTVYRESAAHHPLLPARAAQLNRALAVMIQVPLLAQHPQILGGGKQRARN
jgi:hypothetical protein